MLARIAVASSLLAASVTAVAVDAAVADAPPPRAYELVSPPVKGAADIASGMVSSPDGNVVDFASFGTMPGSPSADFDTIYTAARSNTGWTTDLLSPRQDLPDHTSLATSINPQDFSADARTFFATPLDGTQPLMAGDVDRSNDVYASAAGGVTRWLTPGAHPNDPVAPADANTVDSDYAGRSDDGRAVVFESTKQILPDVPGGTREVYEIVDGVTHIVSLVDDGSGHEIPAPTDALFAGGRVSPYNYLPGDRSGVSSDGSRVFFTTGSQLYVRDGQRTVLVSASQASGSVGQPAPSGARFQGASDDGDWVTFTSSDPLTDDATAGGLYGYDIGSGVLRLLADASSSSAVATVHTAPDASRVYFTTTDALDGDGTAGSPNLWVAHADGTHHFIATLDPGDSSLLMNLGENQNTAPITADGGKLAFQSLAKLTRYDSGGVTEVYVYDDTTQQLSCASCPPGAADPGAGATLRDPRNVLGTQTRNFASDGDLFFETAVPLTQDDTEDKVDVYEYADGRTRLISPGTSTDTYYVDNSVDGSSVFMLSRDSLVPADDDHGYQDVYVARVGGGFPASAPSPACTGEACRPAPTPATAPPAAPDTAPAFDVAPGVGSSVRPTFSVTSVTAGQRRAFARTGKLSLKVKVSAAAVFTATGRGQIGHKRVTVATGSTSKLAAGRTTLTVKLTTKARRALARNGRLTVRLTITCSDTTRSAHATLVLQHAKTTKKGR
ncbi:hypothetical protein DSM104299_01153 [Baekduia alba]|uniref:hypothetical protein n=1 Tax=Baekduia alba TaxID=2997333 RepID=UPI00234199AA|nr:hypothetical protein [Baekduia alba]WCB92457.1 hypothetical protein DSM104299_01153 [Baekduia alba]